MGRCDLCGVVFASRNQLFKHLREARGGLAMNMCAEAALKKGLTAIRVSSSIRFSATHSVVFLTLFLGTATKLCSPILLLRQRFPK